VTVNSFLPIEQSFIKFGSLQGDYYDDEALEYYYELWSKYLFWIMQLKGRTSVIIQAKWVSWPNN